MTSLLRDLALETEDFSSQDNQQPEDTLAVNDDIDFKEKYHALLLTHEELELTHHKTLGEVTVLKDTITTLREDFDEAKKHIERQKEQESEFQQVEEENADLREECDKHVSALKELQACHSDLEHSLSDANGQVHALQMERKTLQENLSRKDEMIAKLERELCDADKSRHSIPQIERSLSTFSGSDGSTEESSRPVEESETRQIDDTDKTVSNSNPNELSLADQVEDLKECARRSSSRLSYLNSRLSAKDEMIQKLQNRIEEVITERDSFREALQMSFITPEADANSMNAVTRSSSDSALNSNKSVPTTPNVENHGSYSSDSHDSEDLGKSEQDDDKVTDKESLSLNIPSPSSEEIRKDASMGITETKSSPPSRPQTHRKTKSDSGATATTTSTTRSSSATTSPTASVLGNWQNTMAAATGLTTDGLKGVTSSLLGSYLGTSGGGGGGGEGSSGGLLNTMGLTPHHKQYIAHLEKKINMLQQKNKKLTELKSLIPVVEELKEKVHIAEEAAKETDKWADEEFTLLSKKLDDMRQLRKDAVAKYQHSQIEVEDLKQQIARTANTYSNFEDKLQEKVKHAQIVEKELKLTKENTVDIAKHQETLDRVSALMGESKHWQQKAQSLSKEMHRSMTVQMDYNRKKEEILKLEKKIEELEMERMSFKEAMQEMMLDQSRAEQQAALHASEQRTQEQVRNRSHQEKAGSFAKSWLGNIL